MKKLLFIFLGLVFMTACGDDNGGDGNSFDRKPMLENYADQIILPAFTAVQMDVQTLQTAFAAFKDAPDAAKLESVKTAYENAFSSYQKANLFNFGPAAEAGLKKTFTEEVGTFPTDTVFLENQIAEGLFSFNDFRRDSRGFLALDYLFYKKNTSETLQDFMTSNDRISYANATIEHISTEIQAVLDGWTNYKADFLNATGTDVGSSTSALYNEFVKGFEGIKNFKIALPAGLQAGQTGPEPNIAEAYHSGLSLQAIKTQIELIENIYFGRSQAGANGIGFDDYLKTVMGGEALVLDTQASWLNVKSALNDIPTDKPLATLMAEEHPSIAAFEIEMQKHTRYFKSDMSSLLGIAITFASGDGD